jgi:50S ribosomal subunit-associated GTPase HflX
MSEADPSAVLISATTGEGLDELLDTVAARVALDQQQVSLSFDLARDDERDRLMWLYRHGRVHSQVMQGDHASVEAEVPRRLLDRVKPAAAIVGGKRRA